MPKLNLSVCVLVKDEEKKLVKCLESVKDWAKEIVVVVDDLTGDKSEAVARKLATKVVVKLHQDNFHINKQAAVELATGEWILWLDADEEVEPALAQEIQSCLKNPTADGYLMPRKNIIFGKWIEHSGWYPDWQLRLWRRGKGHWPCKTVHENPEVEGRVEKLTQPLKHDHYNNLSQFLSRLDRYTSLDAKLLEKEIQPPFWQQMIKRPIDEFIKRFVAWEGYKDGSHGLALALLQSFSTLVTVLKVWEGKKFQPEDVELSKGLKSGMKKFIHDFKWWKRELKIQSSRWKWQKNLNRVLRRLGF